MTELERVVVESRKLRPTSKAAYARAVREWIAFSGADPRGWTREAAKRWYEAMLRRVRPQTAGKALKALKYATRRLANETGDTRYLIADWIELVPGEQPAKRRALTEDELVRLIAACAGPRPVDVRDRALVVLLTETGMRRSSASGITFSDLGVDERRGFSYCEIVIKGGGRHKVPLSLAARAALGPWLAWLRERGFVDGPVFRSLAPTIERGGWRIGTNALAGSAIYEIVAARAKRAGITTHPHALRTSLITKLVADGTPPRVIAALTGHRIAADGSSAIIEGTYTDASALAGQALAALTKQGGA